MTFAELLELEHTVHLRMYSCYKAGDDTGYVRARGELERVQRLLSDKERALLEPDDDPF